MADLTLPNILSMLSQSPSQGGNAPPQGYLASLLAGQDAQTNQAIAQNTGAAIPAATTSGGTTSVAPVTVAPSALTGNITPPAQGGSTQNVAPVSDPNMSTPSSSSQTPPTPDDGTGYKMPLNYDNSADVQAMQAANAANKPQGGMANPGLYGLLPANLQHGTLRNVLGAIGDAFLVGGGKAATYEPRMENQEIGNAMAGYANNPQAAIERVAGTGAAGSPEIAAKMEETRQTQQYNQAYREQMLGAKYDTIAQRYSPYAAGQISQIQQLPPAQQAAAYKQAHDQWDQRMKTLSGGKLGAEDVGFVDPTIWNGSTPTAGMTQNQDTVHMDRVTGQQYTNQRAAAHDNTILQAAGINNQGRVQAAGISANRPSDAEISQTIIGKMNNGEPLGPGEQQWVNSKLTYHPRGNSIPLIGPGGGAVQPAPQQQPQQHPATGTPQQPTIDPLTKKPFVYDQQGRAVANGGKPVSNLSEVKALPSGAHFLWTDGTWRVKH